MNKRNNLENRSFADDDVFHRAIGFAMEAHRGQIRKDGVPYILHPFEDAAIVSTMTHDPEVLAAAVLHDTVEDTEATPEIIKALFGDRVYKLVMHETENKRPDLPSADTWRVRKEESLAALAASNDPAVKMLWLGDKLSNMRAFYRLYLAEREKMFDRLNNHDPRDHAWYYGTILELLSELKAHPAYAEYERLYREIFDRYHS